MLELIILLIFTLIFSWPIQREFNRTKAKADELETRLADLEAKLDAQKTAY